MTHAPEQLCEGLWRWTARHPEWHPGEFGSEVASFAVQADGDLLLLDPLLPSTEPEPVLELVDGLVDRRLAILITVPYHVRSAEELWVRYRTRLEASIWGHPAAAKRLGDRSGFREIDPATPLPAGVSAYAIGRPRRHETPLHVPSQSALVFGDAVVEAGGKLRVWANEPVDQHRVRFYSERFNPTLEPLLELGADRVLVTHGMPVMEGGTAELEAALKARPWHHRG
jgi:hypothetical protein